MYQAKCSPFRRLHVTSVILGAQVHALHSYASVDGRTDGPSGKGTEEEQTDNGNTTHMLILIACVN